MITKIKLRNDTSQNWQNNNPILSAGEAGYDNVDKVLKIGDGVTTWNDLDFYGIKKQRLILQESMRAAGEVMFLDGENINVYAYYQNGIAYKDSLSIISAAVKIQARESFNFMGVAVEAGAIFYWEQTELSVVDGFYKCETNYDYDGEAYLVRENEIKLNQELGWQIFNNTAIEAAKWRLILDVNLA